jgi:formylglycine-generating enzyme required for sulfatase activity
LRLDAANEEVRRLLEEIKARRARAERVPVLLATAREEFQRGAIHRALEVASAAMEIDPSRDEVRQLIAEIRRAVPVPKVTSEARPTRLWIWIAGIALLLAVFVYAMLDRAGKKAAVAPAPIGPRVSPLDGLTYVFIPPGKFTMGCSPGDTACGDDERPPHTEETARGFWLGQTEVTQAAWKRVMKGDDPSYFKGDQLPVESVNWDQASAYCTAIGGRLPTEKEWEYAARARTEGSRYGPLDAVAWHNGNSDAKTHPVGLKQANAFGLFDMLGNVWEWTSSDYAPGNKIVRGGSWVFDPGLIRASLRSRSVPTVRSVTIGFRCVGEFR